LLYKLGLLVDTYACSKSNDNLFENHEMFYNIYPSLGCHLLHIITGFVWAFFTTLFFCSLFLLFDIFYQFALECKMYFIEAYTEADRRAIDSTNKRY
jgi:hypothetical protein